MEYGNPNDNNESNDVKKNDNNIENKNADKKDNNIEEKDSIVIPPNKTKAEFLCEKYAESCYTSAIRRVTQKLKPHTPEYLDAKLAEDSLSKAIFGQTGTSMKLIMIKINDSLSEQEAIDKLIQAEVNYIADKAVAEKMEDMKNLQEIQSDSLMNKAVKMSIVHWHIPAIFILIYTLIWSAIHLEKEVLALISATIGGAITTLFAERSFVLNMKSGNDKKDDKNNNEEGKEGKSEKEEKKS